MKNPGKANGFTREENLLLDAKPILLCPDFLQIHLKENSDFLWKIPRKYCKSYQLPLGLILHNELSYIETFEETEILFGTIQEKLSETLWLLTKERRVEVLNLKVKSRKTQLHPESPSLLSPLAVSESEETFSIGRVPILSKACSDIIHGDGRKCGMEEKI
jgi:hypothetical protein